VLASLPAGALKTRFSIEFPTHAKSRNVNSLGYLDFVDKRNGLTRGFHISQANENGKIKESKGDLDKQDYQRFQNPKETALYFNKLTRFYYRN